MSNRIDYHLFLLTEDTSLFESVVSSSTPQSKEWFTGMKTSDHVVMCLDATKELLILGGDDNEFNSFLVKAQTIFKDRVSILIRDPKGRLNNHESWQNHRPPIIRQLEAKNKVVVWDTFEIEERVQAFHSHAYSPSSSLRNGLVTTFTLSIVLLFVALLLWQNTDLVDKIIKIRNDYGNQIQDLNKTKNQLNDTNHLLLEQLMWQKKKSNMTSMATHIANDLDDLLEMTHKDKKKNPAMEVPQLMYECLRKYREIAANSILLMNENEGMNNEIIELPLAECAGYYSH